MPTSERPPSERGIEYQLIDRLSELSERLDAYERRPMQTNLPVNWWDVLPDGVGAADFPSGYRAYNLDSSGPRPSGCQLMVGGAPDRVELRILTYDGRVIWQRCLFFSPTNFPR